ncbi:branched-chain amino acid ABC transporter permease [Ancylobacter sp. A5.8]|uniref:branched-chain amino acid ABC transporter permease n=1 Tax=Ancylobacter gelatini TaxID=2919920 RepID=UPI001F4D5A12|nr:branched-chain amino acid ABC transporter permease [Ancylobacter gelatini]MCJ8141593.1 branched-chain amino acid ABC transporter permease [Ancylobacter gelatini]
MRALAAVVLALAAFCLVGCGSVIDADQARICRAVAPALHPDGTEIRETVLSPIPGAANAMKLTYRARGSSGNLHPHWLICSFGGQTGLPRFNLTAIDTDRGPLSGIKLLILKRWWLDKSPPEPRDKPPLLTLPAGSAYWLQQGLNGVVSAGIYGLIATSFSLVFGLTGRINLAFGEIGVFGGVGMLVAAGIAGSFMRLDGPLLAAALGVGVASAALLNWVTGRLIILPLARRTISPTAALVATLALSIVLAEALRITEPQRENWLPPLLNRSLLLADDGQFLVTTTPAQMLAAGLCFTAVSTLLGLMAFTRFGRAWRAYAQDPLMAALLGVPVPALRGFTFALAGACAGLAGTVMVLAYGTVQPGDGLAVTLKALISAVIGGIGSVPGAFVGAAVVAGIEALWSGSFNIVYRDVVIYSLLAAFLVLRPGGLLQRAAPSPREF